MTGSAVKPGRAGPWWRQVATLLTLAGLVVTLVFNAIGVWQGVGQQKEARKTEQIRLLTELNLRATDADAKINATGLVDHRDDPNYDPTTEDEAALDAGLKYYEYLAWLYNAGELKETKSRTVFASRLLDAQELADTFLDLRDYPQLDAFTAKGR